MRNAHQDDALGIWNDSLPSIIKLLLLLVLLLYNASHHSSSSRQGPRRLQDFSVLTESQKVQLIFMVNKYESH